MSPLKVPLESRVQPMSINARYLPLGRLLGTLLCWFFFDVRNKTHSSKFGRKMSMSLCAHTFIGSCLGLRKEEGKPREFVRKGCPLARRVPVGDSHKVKEEQEP